MTRLRWLLPWAIFVALGASAPEPSTWIRDHAIPLKTVEPAHGFDDLQPLAPVVGDARIVALGEATHGTREFFQLKHRLIEFLASQKGFTIFSIEANMPEAYRLNDFVLNGNGDPKKLLKGLYFWTWDTEEVLGMILWMREFNRSGKGRIEFTGFDMQTPNMAMDLVRHFVKEHDAPYFDTLNRAYTDVENVQKAVPPKPTFGAANAIFPVKLAAGHRIKYSGYIRTQDVTQGSASLWWRVDGASKMLSLDTMPDHGAKGTTPWTLYEMSIDVPAEATKIAFGVQHPGNGTAWFDSLRVDIDGVSYTDSSDFDLDFESATPRGFETGGEGHVLSLDNTVAHTGKQSLRSITQNDPNVLDPRQVAEESKRVLEHLDNQRAILLHDSSPKDVDWTIQNARLVQQFMLLKTEEQSRDKSMAQNVEWIADHNPGAKIILWAHNGHVEYKNPPGFDPMGRYLHERFGHELVNFGFSFNEGSFRAIETGKGLHEFTVGPLGEGSFDGMLASARVPLFALDLRHVPEVGPVAQWFAAPHDMRSIGAQYGGGQPESWSIGSQSWPGVFDVILFVEKTTASRGNPKLNQ